MISLTIPELERQIGEFLHRAEAGEKVILTRAGKPVLQIVPVYKVRKPLPFAELAKFRAGQTLSPKTTLEDIRAIRQEARY